MSFQLSLAAQYLWGRKLRSALTSLAIVIGVMVIFGLGSSVPAIYSGLRQSAIALTGQVDVTITHKTGEAFSASLVRRIQTVPGIRAIAGSISRTIDLPANFYGRGSTVGTLTLVGVDPVAGPAVHDYTVLQGRFLKPGDGNVAVITQSLADSLGLKLGDTFRLPTADGVTRLQVIGLRPAQALIGNEEVLITLTEAQKLLDMQGYINTIEANLATNDPQQQQATTQQIQARLDKTYLLNALTSESQFLASLSTMQFTLELIGFLSLFMGGFIIFNTFRTVVAERRHDIGMLRAIGASRGTIVGLILTEGLVQGIAGTAVGLLLGYLLSLVMVRALSGIYQQWLHTSLGAVALQPGLLAGAIALGVGVTLLAGLIPALGASRVTPMEALRPGLGQTGRRAGRAGAIAGAVMILGALAGLLSGQFAMVVLGGLLFLLGLVLVAPALVRPFAAALGVLIALLLAREGTGDLAQGNVTRQPSRSAITASATMIGLAIVVGAGGLMWSMQGSLTSMFLTSMKGDYMLVPPAVAVWQGDLGATTALADKIRSVPGVGAVSTLRYAQSSIPADRARGTGEMDIAVLGIDPVTYPQVAGLDFRHGSPEQAYPALAQGRTIIVNGLLAVQAGLNPGDTVTLSTPEGDKDYRVVAVASDVLDAKGNTAYISQSNLRADFNKTEDIFYQINLAQGADPAAVEARLRTAVQNYPQFRFVSTRQYVGEFGQEFAGIYAGFDVFLALLSLPSLIAILNTLAIGVLERTREIGMLRAIGAARGQVRRMIIAEALLLATIGTAFGLLGGLYLSYMLVLGINASGIYKLQYTFPFAGVLAAIAAGLLFGVLAALFPARQAARMEIIQALRYE